MDNERHTLDAGENFDYGAYEVDEGKINQLIKMAGDFIGTHESLQNIECIDIALNHAIKLRLELAVLRESAKLLQPESAIRANIMRHWDKEKIDRFAKHLLGQTCQRCKFR